MVLGDERFWGMPDAVGISFSGRCFHMVSNILSRNVPCHAAAGEPQKQPAFVQCPRVSPQFLAEKSAPEKGLHLICGDVSTGSIPAFAPSLPFELRLGTRRMLFRELKIVPRPASALSANLLAAHLRPLSAPAEGRLGVPMPDVAGCTSA